MSSSVNAVVLSPHCSINCQQTFARSFFKVPSQTYYTALKLTRMNNVNVYNYACNRSNKLLLQPPQ